MFIRVKKLKGNEYAYLVQNRRVRGKVKQKVKNYLGRVYSYEKINDNGFFEFVKKDVDDYMKDKQFRDIVKDLIRWEFYKHNIKGIDVDYGRLNVKKGKKDCAVRLNDGFLYNKSLRELIRFTGVGDDEREIGYGLAEKFVKAGIKVPEELFVKVFEKHFRIKDEE
ncbi:MAG: hypothetical protein KAU20_05290 [Nanoarchaeota archaeon]|nr:hypothetical protein [Nanoarchaeota archaeon]